jgi:hypothetical protein
MESVPSPEPTAAPQGAPGRDPDLVALEGFEAEFADLEDELEQVERRGGAASGGAGAAAP